MSRGITSVVFVSIVALMGCGDEAEHPDPMVYDDPESNYNPPVFRGGKADDAQLGPRITKVSWKTNGECSIESISSVEIIIEAQSGTHSQEELIFDGSATGCNGTVSDYGPMISAPRSIITCHNVSEHEGMVTVVDPLGQGDSLFFRFDSCRNGHVVVDADEGP